MNKNERIRYLTLLVKKLRRQAVTDDLTQIYNKRYLIERLKDEIERSHRYKEPLSVAIFDVDDFKKYNDKYRHVEGDKVLKTIGKVIYKNSRRIDVCARYGGEEFVVILPETTKDNASFFLDRIREKISNLKFKRTVTISVGIAQLKENMDGDKLIDLADSRLYISKKTGKNRITTG